MTVPATPVGVVANPASGRDVRRLLAAAGTSTPEEQASIVRRVVDQGLVVRFAPPALAPRRVRAPTAPGHHADLGIAAADPLALGEEVRLDGPCVLALDGERRRAVPEGRRARVRVERAGPRVVRPTLALELAAERGTFLA